MNFRYIIAVCVLFCFLIIVTRGCSCSRSGNNAGWKAVDLDTHYEQLLCKRLDYEIKIREAINLYRTTSQKVRDQDVQFRQYLGNRSRSETIDLFVNKPNEIPADLRVAYSCWRTLLPDATQQAQLARWIENQQKAGVLEDFDTQIKEIENYRELGTILSKKELDEIDRLLARPVGGWDAIDKADKNILEKEVIERMKIGLTY